MRQILPRTIWRDALYAVRSLGRRPGRSVSVVFMLGLAIGISTAMFTIVDALILRPAPFKEPDQLARLYMRGEHGGSSSVAPGVLTAWRQSPAFVAVEAAVPSTTLIGTPAGEVTRGIARVTPGVFDLLGGVQPIRGRLFDTSEGQPGSDDRVLLSEDVWRALYHSDPSLLGHTITIDGAPLVVVGVLPSEFRFPKWNTVIWSPSNFEATQPASNDRPVVYVRFAPNRPRADALRLATTAAKEADPRNVRLWAQADALAALEPNPYYQRAVPLLAWSVVLLFIVLCANTSSLLLLGLAGRAREFGIRAALGASRSRLVYEAFLESGAAGAGGIAAGTLIGWALVSISREVLPEAVLLHSLNPLNVDVRALTATSMAGLVATLASALLPAIIGSRVQPNRLLKGGGRSDTETARARIATRALLVSQIALSCTLLFGATLLVRSFVNLAQQGRGFDTRNILIATMELPPSAFPTPASRTIAAQAVEEQVRALSGVTRATWSYGTPPGGGVTSLGDWGSDLPGVHPIYMAVNRFQVGSEFFGVYGIPILRGRPFQTSDPHNAVLVGERFASAVWPGLDPIGHSFTFDKKQFQVIGLVREIRFPSLDRTVDNPQFYERFDGVTNYAMLSVRCDGVCPDPLLMRHRLAAASPALRVERVRALDEAYSKELARPRAAAAVAFAFAVTALIAAGAGLFSLLNHNAARRRREFGIRVAFGASPADVRRLVWCDGLVIILPGILIGTLGALSLARLLDSLLFDVTISDALSWTIVVGVLALAIAAASWHPTRSAVRADPVLLLRDE